MWLTDNLAQSLIGLGLLLLAIEVLILGFATFVLFFVGLGALISGILIYLQIVPASLTAALLSVAISTALLTLTLWRPLKNLQGKVETKKVSNDLIGHRFITTEHISGEHQPLYHYSGINWRLISKQPIAPGTEVEVVEVAVGQFTVKSCH